MKRSIPFWSWNDRLYVRKLTAQISQMDNDGFGGFFMHARSGLKTPYFSDEWFDCIRACSEKAKELGLKPWLYDENGWPSGAAGGKLLSDSECLENYLTFSFGKADKNSLVSYDISGETLSRLDCGAFSDNALNVYINTSISSVDVLDDRVVDKFIINTHEVYEKRFDGRLSQYVCGFFTDEPQYYGNATPFPHLISDYFRNRYNEDVLDGLGLLFVEKKGYEAFRYKFYLACQTLFIKNYSEKVYGWCDKHGLLLTGHYVEEADLSKQMYHCAGVMPFYEYEHIPAIDWLCRRFMSVVPVKQLVSAAAQLGKKEALTECFAMTGWDATPSELKAIAEFQYIYGVSLMCMHLFPYSESGERKNDYPLHFSGTNPWAADVLPSFNEYFDKLGDLISSSAERVEAAVVHPIRSAYITFKHDIFDEYDKSFIDFSNGLAEKIPFHYLDETILEKHGSVEGDKIRCGSRRYSFVILPPDILTIGENTDRLLKEFISNGGKVVVSGKVPVYVDGVKSDLSYLKSNASLQDIIEQNVYSLDYRGGTVRSACRTTDKFSFVSVVNIDGKLSAECVLSVKNHSLKRYNVVTGESSPCGGRFTLKPYESRYFILDENGKSPVADDTVGNGVNVTVSDGLEVVEVTDNFFVLDMAALSYDGVNYSEKRCVSAVFDKLLNERYDGDIYLKYNFECSFVPHNLKLMCENADRAELFVNGNRVSLDGVSDMDDCMSLGDIASFVRTGNNEIVEKMRFYQKESVYYALFGENVTEFLKNSLVYDTYIECLRLVGDFGVFEKNGLKKCALENVFVGKDFVIGEPRRYVRDMIFDGYLFFAGKIKFKKNLYFDCRNVNIVLTGRIHYARLWVNGNYVGEYLFNDSLNISRFARIGENTIEIEITTGSRNLFGPFHDAKKRESLYVTPKSFSQKWNDGNDSDYTEEYSFVRTGIFNYDGQFRLLLEEQI